MIELSIVRSSSKDNKGQLIKTYNIIESNVFNNPETYEIEIEVKHLASKQKYRNAEELVADIQKVAKFVLCGLQKTNFPVSYPEQKNVIMNYMKVIHGEDINKKEQENIRAYPNDFIGPSSKTLQIKNFRTSRKEISRPS